MPAMTSYAAAGYDTLTDVQKGSSYGFFVWMGCGPAADMLTNATYASFTDLGADGDATSLENLSAEVKAKKAGKTAITAKRDGEVILRYTVKVKKRK